MNSRQKGARGERELAQQRSNYQPIVEPLAWMSKPEPVEKEAIA